MPYDVASTKFIEAMLLISLTQQAFEITYSANKQMWIENRVEKNELSKT